MDVSMLLCFCVQLNFSTLTQLLSWATGIVHRDELFVQCLAIHRVAFTTKIGPVQTWIIAAVENSSVEWVENSSVGWEAWDALVLPDLRQAWVAFEHHEHHQSSHPREGFQNGVNRRFRQRESQGEWPSGKNSAEVERFGGGWPAPWF